jgi:ACS family tartrate transporter-like MFS transporter
MPAGRTTVIASNKSEEDGMASATSGDAMLEATTMRKITLRIVPFLMICYFVAFVDRVNAGFAALQMNKDIGLSASVFGLGGGLFFIAYVICEVPSNLAMEKVGARLWIARIMITWGIVSGLMALVVGPWSFYAVRVLLGAAEAGFFPGVILYLTYWFPSEYRGRVVAVFMVAIPLSSFLGSPISASLLQTDGLLGLRGWQWLFILEAVPAVLLGVLALFLLPNGPQRAKWLAPDERAWLSGKLAAEAARMRPKKHLSLWKALWTPQVLILALVYSGASATSNALSLWQPQILKSYGLSNVQTGLLNAIPFGVASVAMIFWGRRSDRSGERVWNTALPLAVVAISLLSSILFTSLAPMVIILTLALTGTYAIKGPFWALSTEWLAGTAAAAGIAQVNALANLGAFGGSWLLGTIKDATGSYSLALLPLVVLSAAGAVAVVLIGRGQPRSAVSAVASSH